MRITQAFTGASFFTNSFLNKYDLETYRYLDKPVIFFGCYHAHWKFVEAHRSIIVIIWTGTDAMKIRDKSSFYKFLVKNKKRIFHVAISKYIEDDLTLAGLPFKSFPITPYINNDIRPLPLGESIYAYIPHIRQEFYGLKLVDQVKRLLPSIPIIMCSTKDFDRKELIQNIYPKCFIGLRLTPHDGLSNTVVELALCGRRSVCNAGYPTTIPWTDVKSIVREIKKEKSHPQNPFETAYTMKEWLDVSPEWLDTDFWIKGKVPDIQNIPESIPEEIVSVIPEVKEICGTELPDGPVIINGIDVSNTLVTVIINTYREDPVKLLQAVESYENQKDIRVQIIISTVIGDPSENLNGNGRLIISNDTPGIYEQLNNACNFIQGEWVCYASGNDVALPTKCRDEVVSCYENNKLVCYSGYTIVDSELNILTPRLFHPYDYITHLAGNFVNDCAMINTKLLQEFLPFRNNIYGNHAYWDLWLRIYEHYGNVFHYNNQSTWLYRQEPTSSHILRQSNIMKKKRNIDLRIKLQRDHDKISKNLRLKLRNKPHSSSPLSQKIKYKIFYQYSTIKTLQPVSGDQVNEIGLLTTLSMFADVYFAGQLFQPNVANYGLKDYSGPIRIIPADLNIIRANKEVFMACKGKRIWMCSPYDEYCFRNSVIIGTFTKTWMDLLVNGNEIKDPNYPLLDLNPKNICWKNAVSFYQTVLDTFTNKQGTEQTIKIRKSIGGDFIIGIFGRITEQSFPDLLLGSIDELKKEFPNLKIILAITRNKTDDEIPLSEVVQITRFSYKDVPYAISACDVIIPANHEWGWQFAGAFRVLEPMACGTPIICQRSPAREEMLGKDYPLFLEPGILSNTKSSSIQSLVKKICLLKNPSFVEEIKKTILERSKFYSVKENSIRMETIITKVIQL